MGKQATCKQNASRSGGGHIQFTKGCALLVSSSIQVLECVLFPITHDSMKTPNYQTAKLIGSITFFASLALLNILEQVREDAKHCGVISSVSVVSVY